MNKKILNFLLSIIVILIVIIFTCVFYIFSQNRASSSIFDDIQNKDFLNLSSNEFITLNNKQIDKIYPFTGAFPYVDIIPFIFENKPIKTFSNEQILRLGFAKVTKEDWAATYIAENESVAIPASLLDKYIKDVFGDNVQYTKENFSNTEYSIDKTYTSPTSSYNATYVSESDTYVINHIAGDGIDENFVYLLNPIASRIQGNFEIDLPYVFIEVSDELVTKVVDGTEHATFEYIIYANCNFETKTFSQELGRFSGFDINEDGEFIMSDIINNICSKHLNSIQKLQFIYEGNENKTEQILKEIR